MVQLFFNFLPLIILIALPSLTNASMDNNNLYHDAIQQDWNQQELEKKRSPNDPSAIKDAFKRCELLLDDLSTITVPTTIDIYDDVKILQNLREKLKGIEGFNEEERRELYYDIRWLARSAALKNPLLGSERIVFMKRRRFICQMLHEYMGYYYDYGDISGGGIHILEEPGKSFKTKSLTDARFPRGNFTTLSLTYDANKIYFGFAERNRDKTDFYSPDRSCFQLYSMDIDGANLTQLTSGLNDYFDPCELPNGDIAFMSTRRGGFIRCSGEWEPLLSYNLHRMNPDGSNIQLLSFHETNEWHPSVLNDGRIIYTRWDYVDRSAAHFHGLWVTQPDGSNSHALFGNFTRRINACYQPRAIPGSDKIAFLAGAHHASVGGSLVILDPNKTSLDPTTGQDDFKSIESLTPDICFPEAPGWPDAYVHSPWPLSENYFLVSYSHDPLPGMGPDITQDTETGLYLFDRFGNLELLYREEGISSMYPIPLRKRERPPVIPSSIDSNMGEEGEFVLTDINKSHFPLPSSRPIQELRVFQVIPKSETHIANKPRLGYANAESARMLLGAVPVEKDGSAYFRAPARKPLMFQAVDQAGRAVQGMRSITYLQPGERRGCVGCHESVGTITSPSRRPIAMKREPSILKSGPDGSHPWSYTRLIQPILDQHCISCHDGSSTDKKGRPDLRSAPHNEFSLSYESIKPFAKWYEWGGNTIAPLLTRPGNMPADVSALPKILSSHIQENKVNLSDKEMRRIYLWLDGNSSFYGSFSSTEQVAQRNGKIIPPPKLQ